MLPFLTNKQEGSVSAPVESVKRKPDEESDQEVDMLESVIKELFEAKTDKERAYAFRVAFELLEQEQGE